MARRVSRDLRSKACPGLVPSVRGAVQRFVVGLPACVDQLLETAVTPEIVSDDVEQPEREEPKVVIPGRERERLVGSQRRDVRSDRVRVCGSAPQERLGDTVARVSCRIHAPIATNGAQ
jgi:hypothetical protein